MELELEDDCPRCGSRLVLKEGRTGVSVGCPRCRISVIYSKSLVRNYVGGSFFNWRKLVVDMVQNYREASKKVVLAPTS